MDNKKPLNKSVLAVSMALVLVLFLVIAVFVFGQADADRIEIALPEVQTETSAPEEDDEVQQEGLLQVTTENVVEALSSLTRPTHYHQSFHVEVGKSSSAATSMVEVWVSGSYRRAQVTTDRLTKVILANDTDIWLWYTADESVLHLKTDNGITFEDVIGMPGFDYLQTLQNASITDAEYLVLEGDQQQTPCIFLSAVDDDSAVARYWIDLNTGLLFEADAMENNLQIYRVKQRTFDRLVDGDEAFADRFILPDGTSIVTEGTNTQQSQ